MLETSARLLRLLSLFSGAPVLGRAGTGGAAGSDVPDAAERRGETAEPGVSDPFDVGSGGRVSAGGGVDDAAAAAGRRRGGGGGRWFVARSCGELRGGSEQR